MVKIKLGIIGAGNMGKNHIRLAKELSETFELIGIYDPDQTRLGQMGLNSISAQSSSQLIDQSEAIIVAAPSSLHKTLGIEIGQKGKHLLMEKPLALSYKDAQEVVAEFTNKEAVFMVGHVERFNPVVVELEKVLANECIVAVEINRCSPQDYRISDTDVVYDLMIHDVDIMYHSLLFAAELSEIAGFGKKVYSKNYVDYVQAVMKFENGVIGSIVSSRTTEGKIRTIRIHCEKCLVEADLFNKTIIVTRKTQYNLDIGYNPVYSQEAIVERIFVPNNEPLKEELLHFANCIKMGSKPKTDAESTLKSISILDRIKDEVYA